MDLMALELSEKQYYENKIKELESIINDLNSSLSMARTQYLELAGYYSKFLGLIDDNLTNLQNVRNSMRLDKVISEKNENSSNSV